MIQLSNYEAIIDRCSQCNYCQATCPVYLEDMVESVLARNRIHVIQETMINKSLPLTPRAQEIIDRCLLCTNCVQTCSSQIPIDEIIIAARSELNQSKGGLGNIKNLVMGKLLTERGFTGMMGKAGALAQKLGIGSKEMPTLASKTFDKFYSGTIAPIGEKRGRVAYFVGCGTNFMYPDTGVASVKVLTHNGIEVVIPAGQVCCGIPSIAEGDLKSAEDMLRTNIKIFADMDVDAIITDCTSCGMMFKEKYPKILPDNDPANILATQLAAKIWEVTDYLNHINLSQEPGAINITYTYHVPCHRGWSPTVRNAPRTVLAQIPQMELKEMDFPEHCCGAAGTFFMEHRDLSSNIRSHKVADINDTGADLVVTQCPICRFYLSAGLKNQEVLHPIALLAQSYGF